MIWEKNYTQSLLTDFKDFGGTGIEVMSGSQDPSQSNYFAELAEEYNLFAHVALIFMALVFLIEQLVLLGSCLNNANLFGLNGRM